MKILFFKKIPKKYLHAVFSLMQETDKEFVPPLSSRQNTTQLNLNDISNDNGLQDYFATVSRQWALLAVEQGELMGFMSLKPDHRIPKVKETAHRNVYLSTIIVDSDYRRMGVARALYAYLTSRFADRYIITRTWSTNYSHLQLLNRIAFYEVHCDENDRGEGIDTVYYCHENTKRGVMQVLKQYHLQASYIFLILMGLLALMAILLWLFLPNGLVGELSIAVATSLMASVLCVSCELMFKYVESKNDEYIFKLKSFGIENLLFHKDVLLKRIIPKCKKELWITGYRLIMTAKNPFLDAIHRACKETRGLKIRLLFVPMWSDTYSKVYGNQDVTENYIKVLYCLCNCAKESGAEVEIRVTDHLIFNDTYKVDNRILTGPYLNCASADNSDFITAKDFFSLDITDSNKTLYQLMESDYQSVWDGAVNGSLDMTALDEMLGTEDKAKEWLAKDPEETVSALKNCIAKEKNSSG